jgi:hypothetical protein
VEVNGQPTGWFNNSGENLCATIQSDNQPAKLAVAPCFLPAFLEGCVSASYDKRFELCFSMMVGFAKSDFSCLLFRFPSSLSDHTG